MTTDKTESKLEKFRAASFPKSLFWKLFFKKDLN